ncbi:hypothetical protein [Flavobacterium sp. MMS24-S5]|uniref:hypothetical protein n=1 Tax=Flavobacterium sp. MMS24-S5 TaxID=3416605 RepID=UPI003CFF4F5B
MTQILYDGSYEGWLTAIFEIYEYKLKDVVFAKEEISNTLLFSNTHSVTTDEVKANRVLNGLQERLSHHGFNNLYFAFLSELDQIEEILFRFIEYVFASKINIEGDLSRSEVLNVKKQHT